MISRAKELSKKQKEEIKLILEKERKQLIKTYEERELAIFSKYILFSLTQDKRIKDYIKYYNRNKKSPLKVELKVLDVIEERLNLNKLRRNKNGK